MKKFILIILAVTCFACQDNIQDMTGNDKIKFTFNVNNPDKHAFKAVIHWGLKAIEYNEGINNNGYASGFEAKAGDTLVLQVDSDLQSVEVSLYQEFGPSRVIILETNKVHQIEL